MNHILNPLGQDKDALEAVFKNIAEGNTILLLGAGASITEKKYLSKQIIEYYEDKVGKHLEIPNITEFLDVISENPWFIRNEFDNYVATLLNKLAVTDIQRTILRNPWREIITTNFDLLIEKADYELKERTQSKFDLVYVRRMAEFHQTLSNNQIKYIKLNGCLSDKSKYPLLFSTADFNTAKGFYRTVLQGLKTVSDQVSFLSVGYSFSDDFAKQLLESFDAYNYRDKRWIWNVDPYPNENKLPYYSKQKIAIIRCSVAEFFKAFTDWEEKEYGTRLKKVSGPIFSTSTKAKVSIPSKLAYNLKGVIEQLNSNYQGPNITEGKFYKGEEPNYNVIENDFDVIRTTKLKEINQDVKKIASQSHPLVPIIFLTGNFGTGKTTFNYRLIHDLTHETGEDRTAFEIIDIDRLKREEIKELIETVKSRQMIFYCNNVEIDSVYKLIIDLRNFLSTLQFSEINIFFLLSIRENALEIYRKSRSAKCTFDLSVDSKLTRQEIGDLLEKLKRNNLISFRDTLEKNNLIQKVEKKYGSDSFITLLNTITDGKHIDNLRDAYYALSKQCRKAFVYTALVHRHNLVFPSSVLRNLVATDWEDFRKNVINVEGRGILIQDDSPNPRGTDPDLYFRTKHPIIAEKLINEIHPREDKRFSLYKEIVKSMDLGIKNSKFLINLIKAIRSSEEFSNSRINQLFDLGATIFFDDPHFLLHYAINLQSRNNKNDIENALEKIKYAETLLEFRNDKFIHRKGSLYFRLAKIYFKEEGLKLNLTFKCLNEAKDWLILKQQLDPCSAFSYTDLLDLFIWELDNIKFGSEEEAKKRINIEDYFELALNTVTDGQSKILELKEKYESIFQFNSDHKEYLKKLDEMYEDVSVRPFACILMFNFYLQKKDTTKTQELLEEIELYQEEDEIAKFLFKHYGRNLSDPNTRMDFFRLARKMEWYEEQNPLRYNYYHYVAESYNMQMHAASEYLNRITDRYQYLNPEYQRFWDDPQTKRARIFEGVVQKTKKGFKIFKCNELTQQISFTKDGLHKVNIGDKCQVQICFFLNGKRAILYEEN
jgi:hypothetical protein